jgi:hypothetical protein
MGVDVGRFGTHFPKILTSLTSSARLRGASVVQPLVEDMFSTNEDNAYTSR